MSVTSTRFTEACSEGLRTSVDRDECASCYSLMAIAPTPLSTADDTTPKHIARRFDADAVLVNACPAALFERRGLVEASKD
jgi:hypothetical protein